MTALLRDVIAGAIVLGVLVLFHEWGHFVVAKLCGVRVEVFSIGFGPRLWGWKRGATDYRLSALPLGGYVRMAGDNPAEERSGAPDEFLSRPRWQRFLVVLAGPVVNIILTFLILWGVYGIFGLPIDPTLRQPATIAAVPQGALLPIQPGDRIVAVNGGATPTWEKVLSRLSVAAPGSDISMEVARAGSRLTFKTKLPAASSPELPSAEMLTGYEPITPEIGDLEPGKPGSKAGLRPGDQVISINGSPIVAWGQMVDAIQHSNGRTLEFMVRRAGGKVPVNVTPTYQLDPETGQMTWMIGAAGPQSPNDYERQNWPQAIHDAFTKTSDFASLDTEVLVWLFRGKLSVRELAGPVGIVQFSGKFAQQGPGAFLIWMAFISLDLGLINLLPIPILDGGHILMFAIEGGLRRDLSLAFKERFVQVGIVFILALFALVMYSDITRWIQNPH